MNIAIVTSIFPPDVGGPATYVPTVAAGLAERGHRVTVLAPGAVGEPAYPFRLVPLPPPGPFPLRTLRTVARMIRAVRGMDVILAAGLMPEAALAAAAVRTPLVVRVVGDVAWERATTMGWTGEGFESFQHGRYGPRVAALRALRSWWCGRARAVITPSRDLVGWLGRWGAKAERIVVVPNGVALEPGLPPRRPDLPTAVNAVSVGRLIPLKRVDGIIAALAQVEGLGLMVVGDGPERSRLEAAAAREGVRHRVEFAGRRSRSETRALIAGADLLVLHSLHETFPYAALEAMSLGLPVVAPRAGGIPEIVEDGRTGITTDGSTAGLVQALGRLVASADLRRAMGAEGRRRVLQEFSLSRAVAATERVLAGATTAAAAVGSWEGA